MTRHPLALITLMLALGACQREERAARPSPVGSETQEQVALVKLSPGVPGPTTYTSGKAKEFEGNAYHLSQGKKLFTWYNCNGCHASGGGGMGPALIDDRWIYGGSIENIVQTIREGRPNGMPSFRGRVPDDQIWELAAYVRSMSGNAPASAAPARSDSLHPHPAENRTSPSPPVSGGIVPPSGLLPQ
ncbi:c-type cytochrome [Methylobacterium oxalidis]|uniref:Cytochrome c n=1 Tax=Methylobacterium oxalidis TaxID=944322 RepID=A0A512JAQ1_9HYPH|nr:c-type cytochrome [Methylobacterium oxalidis]GEP07044.1 cytochrome c [Methylobacterium oxalidis]GJE35136.1 Cytochrome c6 [Methylobacterium oxalidis]GLS67616.1 cytochrome c [Methylobacterium oxalidis]